MTSKYRLHKGKLQKLVFSATKKLPSGEVITPKKGKVFPMWIDVDKTRA